MIYVWMSFVVMYAIYNGIIIMYGSYNAKMTLLVELYFYL